MGRCLPETIFGQDIDDVFAYPTLKYVRIRDARLGILKLSMGLCICLYVALYQLAYSGNYLEKSAVTGAARLTIQQPTKDGCNPSDAGCKNDFTSVRELPYCAQSALAYGGQAFACEFYENVGASVVMDKSVLLATRITTTPERLVCDASTSDTCPFLFNATGPAVTSYVADAERFTVMVDHSVSAQSLPRLQGTSTRLKGRLLVRSSNELCRTHQGTVDDRGRRATDHAPCYIKPNGTADGRGLDFFSLDVIMRAAKTTYRETGACILLSITYNNFRGWPGLGKIWYTYEAMLVQDSTYKHYETEYSSYRQERTLVNMHGIFVEVVQQGSLSGWSFNNLLIQLTTSLTLFAVATVITDFTALYLLPDHAIYGEYKFDQTPDFSELRQQRVRAAALAEQQTSIHAPLLDEEGKFEDEEWYDATAATIQRA